MPRSSSTSRADARRRDRRKVYAVADLRDGDRDDNSPPPATMKEGSNGSSSSPASTLSRVERERCDSKAASTGVSVGVRVDDRNSLHEGPATPNSGASSSAATTTNHGSVGPGAEPPVAVASHAFAHEEPHRETPESNIRSKGGGQEQDGAGPSVPCHERAGALSGEEGVGTRGSVDGGDDTEPSRRYQSGKGGEKEDVAGSRPGSTNTNTEEEAETLAPDSFNLSDEYGLEGASTGRNHHDNEGDYDEQDREPAFFGLDVESTSSGSRERRGRGQGRPAAGRYSRTRRDDESWSEYGPRRGNGSRGVYASASDSDGRRSSSQEQQPANRGTAPQPQHWFGQRARQNPRRPLLTAPKRASRIVPAEDVGEPRAGESEGTRRHRRGRSRNGAKYRSPPRRRHPRGAEEDGHRRRSRQGVSGNRIRASRRIAESETESLAEDEKTRFEAEVARLRRENEALKQQQERPTRCGRLSDEGLEAESWKNSQDLENHHARILPRHSSQRHDPTARNARHHKRCARTSDVPIAQERARDSALARASNPVDAEFPSARSCSSRRQHGWSDFVARSKTSPQRQGPAAWETASLGSPTEVVDLGLPRILVEGGFLWKLPYHNAGTPKRRWFQVKPADGLLTTASGRLVVRPTVAGASGAAARDSRSGRSKRSDEGGSDTDLAMPMPMMRLRAAWPLAFIWVDPDKDLKRSLPREICIEEVVDLARGHKTPAFWQQAAHRGIHTLPDPKLCFSLVGNDRTLDLAAETLVEAKEWVRALARVTVMIKRGGIAISIGNPARPLSRSKAEPVDCSDVGEVRIPESADDDEDDAGTLCPDGLRRQRPDQAGPHHDLSAPPDEAVSIPKSAPLLGEGGAWSVNTIRAWRRRLFPAVTRGDVPAVLDLFDQGCPVDLVQTGTGDTPMLLACRLGDVEMARECLRRGSRNDPHPAFGQTALHAAVTSGREACARLLLETAAPSRSDAVISNQMDPNKETPLHVACRRGYSGIVDALLHHGADMRAVDKRGNTPLHGAAGGGHAAALASLLDAGGDGVLEERNARGERALHAAAAAGHIACVELLLGTAAEPDVPNEDGQTPFTMASRGGHLAVTRLIRRYAPAAGTPSGGDAQFQTLQLRGIKGGSATADALPRPHASGSTSSGPATPDHRRRDLEHRRYSSAGLDQRQLEARAGGREPPPGRQPACASGTEGCGGHRKSGPYGHDGESHVSATPRSAVIEEQVSHSPRAASSAPVHGSLFDGLQVYVVGGRQPLGSQHASGITAAECMSARSAHTSARTMVLDSHRVSRSSRQHQPQHPRWEQPQAQPPSGYPLSQQASMASTFMASASTAPFSQGALEPNWRDNVLSAPSTVAPSPPAPLRSNGDTPEDGSTALVSAIGQTGTQSASGGDVSQVGIPGSARALARMMHFSGDNKLPAPSSAGSLDSPGRWSIARGVGTAEAGVHSACHTGGRSGGGGGGRGGDGMPTQAIGSWMTSDHHDRDQPVSGSVTSTPRIGQCGDEDGTEPPHASRSSIAAEQTFLGETDSPATFGEWVSASGTAGRDGMAEERTVVGGHSFVVKPSEGWCERQEGGAASAPLPGLWLVLESQGYPYYLHEASGHSQWEDPREQLLSKMRATDEVAAGVQDHQVSDTRSSGGEGAAGKESSEEMATKKSVENIVETTEGEGRGHPPPASPIKPAGVSVEVDVSRYVDTVAATERIEISAECVGETTPKSSSDAEQENDNGEFFDSTLQVNSGRINPSIERTDGRNYGSVDTASFEGGDGSGCEGGASLLTASEEEGGSVLNHVEDVKCDSSSTDSHDGWRQDICGNAESAASRSAAATTPSRDGTGESDREDVDMGTRGPLRHEAVRHGESSILVDTTGVSSVKRRTSGIGHVYDDEQREQEEEVEEDWW